MKKYWVLFKSYLSASLEYRGALFTWLLVELVSLSSATFLWLAVFRTNQTVGDYDFGRIVSYYLLVPVIGGFTSIFVSEHLPRKIKDGAISIDLLKPYSISAINLLNQFGIKLTQLTIKLPAYLFAGIFFTHSSPTNLPALSIIYLYIFLSFALLFGFSFKLFGFLG